MNAKVAVHEAGSWSDQARKIDLVLIGARGQVGTAFRHHLVRQSEALRGEGLDLRLLAAFDRRGFAFDEHGLAPWRVDGGLPARREGDNERLLEILCAQGRAPGIWPMVANGCKPAFSKFAWATNPCPPFAAPPSIRPVFS